MIAWLELNEQDDLQSIVSVLLDQRFHHLCVTFDGEHSRPLLDPIGTAGDDGQHLAPIWQREPNSKRAIGSQLH